MKNKKYRFIIIALSIFVVFQPTVCLAVDTDFYSSNDILFYNKSDSNCSAVASSGVSGGDDFEKNDSLQTIFQDLLKGGMNAIQASAVMGNMYAESGFRSSAQEDGGTGLGLVQWSFGRRDNLEAYAASKGVDVSDVNLQIEFLLKEYNDSYKSSLADTVFEDKSNTDLSAATEAWMNVFERPNAAYAHLDRREAAAQRIYTFYSTLDPNAASSTTSSCGGMSNNIIVNTAIKFSRNDYNGHDNATPVDAYAAIETTDPTDCGRFVSNVIRNSNIDSNYPVVGVASQYAYIQSHPEKYKIIDSPTSIGDLQPGDIIIYKDGSHTEIYIGNSAGDQFAYAAASLGTRAPTLMGIYDVPFSSNIAAVRVIE